MNPDVIILGGGVAGLSTAWHLARAGAKVLLLESEAQFGVHSSGQNAAILRTLIDSPALTRLARKSAESLFQPPAGFCESPLVDSVGLVLTEDESHTGDIESWIDAAGPSSSQANEPRKLDHAELAKLAPSLSLAGGASAYYFEDEGHIDIALLTDSFAKGARQAGAELRCGVTATAVETEVVAGQVRVKGVRLTDGSLISCDRVLLAGGAWAGNLGQEAGSNLDLFPRRRHLCVTRADSDIDSRQAIVWTHGDPGAGRIFYMRPESGGMLLCACDETLVAPDLGYPTGGCPKDAGVLEQVARAAASFAPNLAEAEVASWWAGWRTFTGDHAFALGTDADVAGLHWCAGLAGHGMTASFEAGRLAASSAAEGLYLANEDVLAGDDYGGAFEPKRRSLRSLSARS
ncbi:MAG: FAD-dependent oxidoreductase [Planctomycetota bacterium]|nr:FAD-dependent oxidoreductase [Planctomycetota bacterium]